MLFKVIPEQLIAKKNEADLRVHLINGSYIQLMGSDNSDRLRGAGPLGMVLDEYDSMKSDVWPTVEPILRQNGGWAWFIGTPKGKQKLYDLYNRCQLKLGDIDYSNEWGCWYLKASESGLISKAELEESRRTSHSQAFYNQEWECEFLEGEGSVFRNVLGACTAVPEGVRSNELYVMGVDLAKVQDYTVIAVYKRSTRQQVYQDRFNNLEWPFQKRRIAAISQTYNNALVVLDGTGIGDPIADDLMRAGVPVSPYMITNTSKKEMVEKLSIFIEQRKIAMLPIQETLLEFDNFSYSISSNGRIIYNAREGYHDDIVIAHALAVTELFDVQQEKPLNISRIREDIMRKSKSSYESQDEESEYF